MEKKNISKNYILHANHRKHTHNCTFYKLMKYYQGPVKYGNGAVLPPGV